METKNENRKTVVLPFSGFYESLHGSELDSTLDYMLSDAATGCDVNDGLRYRAWDKCNWWAVWREYAKEYAESFAREFELPSLAFESLQSPREYNFTTDRIFCHIDAADIAKMRDETTPLTLEKVARDMFTSRDGFISFYSPDVSEWGDVAEWDHNQLHCLLCAYIEDRLCVDEFDRWAEMDLMEDARCNGKLDSWIADNTDGIERLFRVHDYLESRANRVNN